jgi:hypothetical protein
MKKSRGNFDLCAKAAVHETNTGRLSESGRRAPLGVFRHKRSALGTAPELVRNHSSVDRQGSTDDIGSLVRANEQDGICDLLGSADALVGNL